MQGTITLLFLVAATAAQTTCSAKVAAALEVSGTEDGPSLACCAASSAHCVFSKSGTCSTTVDQPVASWCLGAGKSRACVISYSDDADVPCGTFTGPIGPTFGLSPVGSRYRYTFSDARIQQALTENWQSLSQLSDVSLCTSADDVLAAGAAAPHIGSVVMLSQNPCNPGEFNFKCYGTETDGLCMVYTNVTATSDSKQYYLVNWDAAAPRPSSSSTTPSPSSSGGVSGSTSPEAAGATSPPAASTGGGLNIAAIVAPVVVACVLAVLLFFLFIRRRRRRQEANGTATTPFTPVAASMAETGRSYEATSGQSTHYFPEGESVPQTWTASSLQHQVSQSSHSHQISPLGSFAPQMSTTSPFLGKRGAAAATTNRQEGAGDAPPPLYTPQ